LPPPPKPRVAFGAFLAALLGAVLSAAAVFTLSRRVQLQRAQLQGMQAQSRGGAAPDMQALVAALWATAIAWIAYLLYAVGWLPGSTEVQTRGWVWAAGAVTFIGGLLTLLWTGRKRQV
jgi:hypothetical protein